MTNVEFFTKAFLAFFVVIGPINLMVIFAALTRGKSAREQRDIAVRANIIAFVILLFFAFFGSNLLSSSGISISALRSSGGLFLMVIAYKMIFDTANHGNEYGAEEAKEAKKAEDISVFPLATPLLAGAGAMSATILFASEAGGDVAKSALHILAFFLVLLISCISFIMSSRLQKILGATLLNIIARVMGILLAALAMQFILDGLHGAGVF